MRLFEHHSYKDYLRALIKTSARRGLISELAGAAGCTHSYMSQVLNGKPDLTPDQAWALNEHLEHSKDEADYFFLLVLSGRASSQKLKKALDAKLKILKAEQLRLSKAVQKSSDSQIEASNRDRYYAHWAVSAIHALTASADFQTVDEISKRLNLSSTEVESTLKWLSENSLVKRSGQRFIHSGHSVHLPTEAIHNQVNHLNWRLRGSLGYSKSENVHYTSVFTLSKKDWDILRSDLIAFIEAQRSQIQSSGSEEAYAFCCDLFRI